jgi:hypothetical protein
LLRGALGGGVAGLVSGVSDALAVDSVGVDVDILLAVGLVKVEVVAQQVHDGDGGLARVDAAKALGLGARALVRRVLAAGGSGKRVGGRR